MVDRTFYKNAGPFTLSKISEFLNSKYSGNKEKIIADIAPVDDADQNEICFVSDKYKDIAVWLEQEVGLNEYSGLFIEKGYDDMKNIKEITMEDLESIGIDQQEHKTKLIKAVKKLNDNDNESNPNGDDYNK